MTDERTIESLMAHLRGQVTELRRRAGEGAPAEEIDARRGLVLRLQERLAFAVRDLLGPGGPAPA